MVTPIDSAWSGTATANLLTTVKANEPTHRALEDTVFLKEWKYQAREQLGNHVDSLWPLFNWARPSFWNKVGVDSGAQAPGETYSKSTIKIQIMRNVWEDQNTINQGLKNAWATARDGIANNYLSDPKKEGFWRNVEAPLLVMQLDCQGMDCLLPVTTARPPQARQKALEDFGNDLKERASYAATGLALGGLATLALYALGAYLILGGRK